MEAARKRKGSKKTLNVLVVEDDALIGMLVADVLVAMGHNVCTIAATEVDAIAAAARYKPNLMLVDAWLRDGNGVSAVEEISRTRWVPHVFVTGGDTSRIYALKPSAIVILKPFSDIDLDRAIQRALDAAAADVVAKC
jgi:two-component system, response regulator PdtaR